MNALTRPRLRVSALRLAVLPAWLMSSVLFAQQPAPKPEKATSEARHAVVPDKELLITSREVMESAEAKYPGPLSFGYVMEQLAGKERASEFTNEWLRLWLRDQEINRDIAPARPRMEEILDAWRKKDQKAGDDPFTWTPNQANAPFKLIAVINRMDLVAPGVVERLRAAREASAQQLAFLGGHTLAMAAPLRNKLFLEFGEVFRRNSPELPEGFRAATDPPSAGRTPAAAGVPSDYVAGPDAATTYYGNLMSPFLAATGPSSGEGRLVFALTDAAGAAIEPGFNVIFEYNLAGPDQRPGDAPVEESPTIGWARKWHRLGSHAAFDADYLRDLVAVTKGFTDQRQPGNSSERWSSPTLAQIRTNDGVLEPGSREFREFRLVPGTQPLDPAAPSVMPRLRQAPLVQTPAQKYLEGKSERNLATVLKTRQANFRKEAPIVIPTSLKFPGETEPEGVLGARALLTGPPAEFTWKVASLGDKGLSRHFSLQTCNGCHGGNTNCDDGCHIKGGTEGTLLSAFLSPRPDGRMQGEIRDRATILKALLEPGERDSDATLVKLLHERHRASH